MSVQNLGGLASPLLPPCDPHHAALWTEMTRGCILHLEGSVSGADAAQAVWLVRDQRPGGGTSWVASGSESTN